MYKKVYLEITNNCNLNCSFCIKNNRTKKFMSKNDFKYILDKLKLYTKYLYFHVSGEPLLHPLINEFIDYASAYFFVNITTNGYLIKRIKDNHNIRQINISLHSFNEDYNISLEEYINNIIEVIEKLSSDTFMSLRFWVNTKYNKNIISILEERYNKKIELKNGFEITKNVYISINKEFIWPSLDNDIISTSGTCYGLRTHIGILVDGTVVPCCLDSKGIINLAASTICLDSNLEITIFSIKIQLLL